MNRPPRFALVIIGVALLSLLLSALVAWRVDLLGNEEERRDCERSVAARIDNRTMWLYLVDTTSEPDSPRVVAFLEELDKRLPELECRDGNPVPIHDADVRPGRLS